MHTDNPFTAHAKTWMINLVIMDDVAAAPGKNVNLNGTLRVCERGLRVRICEKLGSWVRNYPLEKGEWRPTHRCKKGRLRNFGRLVKTQ